MATVRTLRIESIIQITAGLIFFLLGIVIAVIIEGIFDLELILFPMVVFAGIVGIIFCKYINKTISSDSFLVQRNLLIVYIVLTLLSHSFVAINYILAAFIGWINSKYKYMVAVFLIGALLWIVTAIVFSLTAIKLYKTKKSNTSQMQQSQQKLNELA